MSFYGLNRRERGEAIDRWQAREDAASDRAFAWYWKDQVVRLGGPKVATAEEVRREIKFAFCAGWSAGRNAKIEERKKEEQARAEMFGEDKSHGPGPVAE